VFASPVSARGRIYFTGREGTTLVIKSGPAFEVLRRTRWTMASMRLPHWLTTRSP